ncbi:MAG: peptide ABC transporter substrate-binding protein [Flavobacteriales bacterium]|nr:peptide ABC transporter substrate-binding protein [Flavobacteriales bacterium]
MKKIVFGFITISILLYSCGGEQPTSENNNQEENVSSQNDNSLDFAITEKLHTLDPINITDVTSFHVLGKIYEPLLRFDEKNLTLQPLLAESWSISDNNLVYTINLKKGVYFQNNPCFVGGNGREIKAADVIYSYKRIYTEKSSYTYSMFKNTIKGANGYLEGDISGLKALTDYSIEFTLNKPSSNFINLLATVNASIVAKEAIEKGAIVGSGPFIYNKEDDTKASLILAKNTNYHITDQKGEKLPYIDQVVFHYIESGKKQVDLFMENKLDIITKIPPSSIKKIVEGQISDFQNKPVKYVLGRYPQIATSYLNLNTAIAPFNNKNIRKAISMAINKEKIVANILKGEASGAGSHGIIPSAIKGYDQTSIIGLEHDIKKAKSLLASEGYSNGKDFPSLTFIVVEGNTNLRVALEIQKQLLSNLNIHVEISSSSLQELTNMHSKSEVNMSLSGWLGEFPDPVSFLSLLYGEYVPNSTTESSYPNESRFKNVEFDKLYEKALITLDTKKRHEICLAADQIIATEVPIIPLWYHENYQLIQSTVTGFQPNAMNTQYITNVKLITPKKEK